jgi:hypothetical protein
MKRFVLHLSEAAFFVFELFFAVMLFIGFFCSTLFPPPEPMSKRSL